MSGGVGGGRPRGPSLSRLAGHEMECRIAVEVLQQVPLDLKEYARIAIAYEVRQMFDVVATANGLGGLMLVERDLADPYLKDYDAMGEGPLTWSRRFDLSNWGLFMALVGDRHVGGAAVVVNAPDVDMLEGRTDLALIWDIRVSPEVRGLGVGSELFRAAEEWSKARSACLLKVETQNTNVPACRFYARQGCFLGAIDRFAYRDLPHETQLLWYKDLASSAG
jgi:GNAT superfamily N-acetyltransferase